MALEHISISQINTYLMCPRKYRYRYIENREPEFKPAAMAFGSAVHTAIEWWSSKRLEGLEPTEEETLRILRADWSSQVAPGDLRFEGKQTAESLQELGEELVRLFIERFVHRPLQKVEERFEVPLINEDTGEELPVPLVGYLDFIEDDDLVGEIKTAAKKTEPSTNHMWTVQLSGYSYAYRVSTGIRPRIDIVELLKTKKPNIEEFEVTRTRREEQWFVKLAFEVYEAITNRSFFPCPSWACPRCEYRRACRG